MIDCPHCKKKIAGADNYDLAWELRDKLEAAEQELENQKKYCDDFRQMHHDMCVVAKNKTEENDKIWAQWHMACHDYKDDSLEVFKCAMREALK